MFNLIANGLIVIMGFMQPNALCIIASNFTLSMSIQIQTDCLNTNSKLPMQPLVLRQSAMNILPLLTFYFIKSEDQFADRDINNEVAQALLYVIDKFFMLRSSSFMFILFTQRGSQHTMNFLKNLMENFFIRWGYIKTEIIINSDVAGLNRPGERIYNLLLVDSWEAFLKIDPASKVQNYDINEYYHIYLHNKDAMLASDMQMILNYCWQNYIINVNVQVQKSTGEIIVYTYFPFTASHCGKVVPIEINRYENGTMKSDNLFPEKLNNMFNCPVRVATWNVPPYLSLDLSRNDRNAIGGYEGELLHQLSKLINFNIEIRVPPNNEERGYIFDNFTTGAIKMLRTRQADMSIGCFGFSGIRSRMLTASHSYFQESNVAVLLASSSNYAKVKALWFPFKLETSMALLATFLLTLGLLAGLAWILEKRPLAVIQRNICLNFIACTLGWTCLIGPRRNSWRIFIISWIFFVLVIRTEYSAAIFHLIRNNLFRKPPSKIHDIVKLEYKFVLSTPAYQALRETSVFSETGLSYIIIENQDSVYPYIEEHAHEKLATITPLNFVLNYLAKNQKVGVLTILKESFYVQNSCIYFTKHSYLVDRVNNIVQRINAVGLMDSWVKKSIDMSYLTAKRAAHEYSIGQNELEGIYYLCGMMLLASFLVFCLEIMSLRVTALRRALEKL